MKYDYYDVALTCTTKALSVGDILADAQAVGNTRAGFLHYLEMFNLNDLDDAITIFFLRSSQSLGNEGSSYTLSDTEVLELLSKVTFASGAYTDFKDSLWQIKTSVNADAGMGVWLENATPATANDVYVAAVMGSTGTYVAAGVKLRVGIQHLV